jgi:predicted phage tail protein
MADLATATEVLGAMITPALLISASGTLVLSNRLSRVVDRVRTLAKDAEQLTLTESEQPQAAKRALISSQLHSLAARAMILRAAMASLYTAVGFLVATSIGVGALTTLHVVSAGWIAILLAMLGACALLWGSVQLVREGRMALGSTLEEMSYVRGLISIAPPRLEKPR